MIGPARPGMERQLRELWQTCFQEPARPVNFYLRTLYRPENCLVYTQGDRLASMVHLLSCRVQLADGGTANAHYIYAAATFPEFRGRGFISSLLACAAMRGMERGQSYSVVLPAHDGLIPLYEKAGYRPYYRVTRQTVTADQLRAACTVPFAGRRLASWRELCRRRDRWLRTRPGSVLWGPDAFFYAAESSRLYGGKLLIAGEGETLSYALCSGAGACCEVTEWAVSPQTRTELFGLLLRDAPAETYAFRLPAGGAPLFSDVPCEERPFGMLKPLSGCELPALLADCPPYLGLSLD